MKERPILFSAPMVQAILAGNKTQTRRIINVQPSSNEHQLAFCVDTTGDKRAKGKLHWIKLDGMNIHQDDGVYFSCPYGQIGDQLWVRETWQAWHKTSHEYDEWEPISVKQATASKLPDFDFGPSCDAIEYRATSTSVGPWTPSIHMPRWASRIQLEITNIRVERLQDISRADAISEGIKRSGLTINGISEGDHFYDYEMKTEDMCEWYTNPIDSFQSLWNSINGTDSWTANPWLWVIEFKRVERAA